MSNAPKELLQQLKAAALERELVKVVFSNRRDADNPILRVEVRPIELRKQYAYQFTGTSKTQAFHKNLAPKPAAEELRRIAVDGYDNLRLTTTRGVLEARRTANGKWILREEATPAAEAASAESASTEAGATDEEQTASAVSPFPIIAGHNRVRNHLIPEGTPCPFLIETGVMTRDGQVRASHAKKFRQINRYLEFINDVADQLPADRPVRIVDFGCGKSYLTFATHYLFTTILRRDCHVIGLDQRSDVVETCQRIQSKLELTQLEFKTGNIADFETTQSFDLVISLHACDTATDHAIAQALRWNARVIMAVPCCQKELNEVLSAGALKPITSYGLSKERFAALATDTMRASLLNAVGYQTQLLEFIETEHTPKNILIRAVRRLASANDTAPDFSEIEAFRNLLQIAPLAMERQIRPDVSAKSL